MEDEPLTPLLVGADSGPLLDSFGTSAASAAVVEDGVTPDIVGFLIFSGTSTLFRLN